MRTAMEALQLDTPHMEMEMNRERFLRKMIGSDWTENDVHRPLFRTRVARMFRNPHMGSKVDQHVQDCAKGA